MDGTSTMCQNDPNCVSKELGEVSLRMHHDKFGIEAVCLRIGSCFPEPSKHRILPTCMSGDNFIQLFDPVFMSLRPGCTIMYGTSANSPCWWDNREAAHLGWQPKVNAEVSRKAMGAEIEPPARGEANARFEDGASCGDGIHES